MKVYKFGGVSVKDADGIVNMVQILKKNPSEGILVVVSAMGKMTSEFEKLIELYFGRQDRILKTLLKIKDFHFQIINDLFTLPERELLEKNIESLFDEIKSFIDDDFQNNYSYVYDQLVGYGELICTTIINQYLTKVGLANELLDARDCIRTDSYYRDANVDWNITVEKIKNNVRRDKMTITQGFIGSNNHNQTTTLGREGSDYSAAIFGYALNAESVTVWKDVPGILNANPKIFDPTVLLKKISYREAIELAFYGASVIHPKTIQPVQRKEIPFYVKSFLEPGKNGTTIGKGKRLDPKVSCYIKKERLTLLKLSSIDFSFIIEKHISKIFILLDKYQMKVEMTQNSAISFSVCFYNKYRRLQELISELKREFRVIVFRNVLLYTIRHYDQASIDRITKNDRKILLEQRTQETAQFVVI